MSATNAIDDLSSLRTSSRSERVERVFDFSPFDWQRRVMDETNPHVLANCGRQVGKTETAASIAADAAIVNSGVDILIAARFQETADELFRRIRDRLDSADDRLAGATAPDGTTISGLGIAKANKTTYELDTGTRILSRTLGNDGSQLRGRHPKVIIIDEAALVDESIYEQVLEPMFATHDDYQFYLFTTPRGKSGYVWEKWNDPDWATYRVPTTESPLVSEEWIEERRDKTDELTWNQEYLGRFVEEGDSYLPHSLVEGCVLDGIDVEALTSAPQDARWLGVDIARKGRDRTVYTGLDEDGRLFCLEAEQTSSMPSVAGRIKALHTQFGFDRIYIDENAVGGGVDDIAREDPELADLQGVIQAVTFTTKSKQEMYQSLKTSFEQGDLTLPDHDRLIHELTSLQFDFTQHGKLRVYHPPGGHDDYPDSLALAHKGLAGASTVRERPDHHGVRSL